MQKGIKRDTMDIIEQIGGMSNKNFKITFQNQPMMVYMLIN